MTFLRTVLHTFHDVLTGGSIFWYKDSYERCILGTGHTLPKPETEKYLEEIRKTVENPNNITVDKDRTDRNCYYRWFTGNKDYPTEPHMKVVVEMGWLKGKEIVTWYFTTNAGSKETQIPWTKK